MGGCTSRNAPGTPVLPEIATSPSNMASMLSRARLACLSPESPVGIPVPKITLPVNSCDKEGCDGYDNPVDALKRACEGESPVVDYRDFISSALEKNIMQASAGCITPQSPCTPSAMLVEYRDSADREASDLYNPYMSTEPEVATHEGIPVDEVNYSTCDYEFRNNSSTAETSTHTNTLPHDTTQVSCGSAPAYSYVQVPRPGM